MRSSLVSLQRDTHCIDCQVDCVETVTHDEGDVIFVETDCCGETVEYVATDWLDLIGED